MSISETSSVQRKLSAQYSREQNAPNQIRHYGRVSFGRQLSIMDPPYLLEIQRDSYREFLQEDVPVEARKNIGLEEVLQSVFPIEGYAGSNAILEYISYQVEKPKNSLEKCRARGLTYKGNIRAKMRLVIYDSENLESKTVKHIREQDVNIAEVPLMVDGGFVINGTDRIVVSQLHRAPGVLFEHDKTKKHVSGRALYTARIMPYRGPWLYFEFDTKNNLFVKIDKYRKIPVTLFLRAFGCSNEEMLDTFFEHDTFHLSDGQIKLELVPSRLWGETALSDILDPEGNVIIHEGQRIITRHVQALAASEMKELVVPTHYLVGKVLAKPIINEESGEILAEENEELTAELLEACFEANISHIQTIYTNEFNVGNYISVTLKLDPTRTASEAFSEIYRCTRPGEFPSQEAAQKLFSDLFQSIDRYDLSAIGRMKLNYRLGRPSKEGSKLLSKADIVDVLKILIAIRDGKEKVDAVDHLGNRRVRRVGEMVANQFRLSLVRFERNLKESLSRPEVEESTPSDLINAKAINAVIKEFFTANPLCQLKDDVNALSAQLRRVSALGKGGVPSDRAGTELRDVDATHYSRLCPIETPEGANIGLINAIALLAKVDEFGFLVAPYRKVVNGKATKEIEYLSALTESNYVIAHANTTLDSEGRLVDAAVPARAKGDSILTTADTVHFMDVSPSQIVSVAASLIPFLEHNDGNRSLMGSNMQRQAVPLLAAEKPLVGTGMEYKVAVDNSAALIARRQGVVDVADASRVVIRVDEAALADDEVGVDIYNLIKYDRTNQGTCRNQRLLVKKGDRVNQGDLLADGSCTDLGELSLGRNLLVAFIPFKGLNYEDSAIISSDVAEKGLLTSIHLHDVECTARETQFGDEEITADIPNINPGMLSNLDESGIIRLGAFVKAGDILVGKITPKGEVQLTPEDKLLRAIFGQKASDVKDTSLRVPNGMSGKVVDVSVFTREGLKKDARSQAIEELELQKFQKNLNAELKIYEDDIYERVRSALVGEITKKGPKRLKAGVSIDETYLNELDRKQWFTIEVENEAINDVVNTCQKRLEQVHADYDKKYKRESEALKQGDELSPGVLKKIKVRLAVTRRIQPGDKIAGRHGNKGVISAIVPVEDMPYMADGTPVDIILNPLGVPSRMNIGQILETHLGWASKALGKKIGDLLDGAGPVSELRTLLEAIYKKGHVKGGDVSQLSDEAIINLAGYLREGVPFATPVFDGIKEEQIRELLALADLPVSGQTTLYDGETGQPFDQRATVGYMYMLKLNHLVDDKMHARSTGSYSLVTQQPLGGKAQFGGQRFGEMEVWALQAYGAAHTLREMLTIKSDDVPGRTALYQAKVEGKEDIKIGAPESFNVLMKTMSALGLNVRLELDASQESDDSQNTSFDAGANSLENKDSDTAATSDKS